MSQVQQLYRLQQIDNEIREKKQRLREVLQAQKQDEELRRAQARQEAAAQALTEARQQQKALEHELTQVNTKARRSEQRMYSGKVTNPKELTDLQQEIASLGRRSETLEEEILETMLLVEETQEEDEAAREALGEVQERWQKTVERLQKEQNELAVRLNELLAAREKQVQRIEPKMMSLYEKTGSRRGGVAVAGLRGGTCQVCGVRTNNAKIRAAEEGKLVYCGSCGRIFAPV